MFSKKYFPKKSLLTEESIDQNFWRTKLILKANKTILLMNTTNKAKLEVIRADLKIKALTQARDLASQETQNYQKKAADDL